MENEETTFMLRSHHWLQPDTCCPHARVVENKVPEITAYSCWIFKRLSYMVRSPRTCISSCLPKIRCPRGDIWWENLTRPCMGPENAPAAWQAELGKTLVELGFRPVVSTSCLYFHPTLDIRVVGHVDDLMCVGPRGSLDLSCEVRVCL